VHTRHPFRLIRTVGPRQAAGFGLLIGGTPAMFLATPLLYAMLVCELVAPGLLVPAVPPWLMVVSLLNLLFGNGVIIYLSLLAGFKRRSYELVPFALLSPLYWLLHSLASYKAAWQLLTKPFYWEKTTHGLSAHVGTAAPVARRAADAGPDVGLHSLPAAVDRLAWRDVAAEVAR